MKCGVPPVAPHLVHGSPPPPARCTTSRPGRYPSPCPITHTERQLTLCEGTITVGFMSGEAWPLGMRAASSRWKV